VVVMVDPDDPDRDEARDVRQIGRPDAGELVTEVRTARRGNTDFEYEERRSDREDAVAEGFEARGTALVHVGLRHVRSPAGTSSASAGSDCARPGEPGVVGCDHGLHAVAHLELAQYG